MIAKSVTICNRLARKDSITGLDVWYKTVLHDIPYKIKNISNVNGTTVSIGQSFSILLPFNDDYLPYNEWVKSADKHFTLSQGDYIFVGIDLEEEVTPNTIQKIKTQYEPNVCEIRSIEEVSQTMDVKYQFRIEGV